MPTKKCRVYVGLPNYDSVMCRRVIANRLSLIRRWTRMGLDYDAVIGGRAFIHFVRTEFACNAIDRGYTHLCMIDDDAVVAPDFLEAWLSYDKDIIGAPYVNRFPPYEIPVKKSVDGNYNDIFNLPHFTLDDMDQGLVPVDVIGTHCILIKTDVFTRPGNPDEMTQKTPFFDLNDEASFVEEHNNGKAIFSMPKQGTEDMFFCHRAKRKGIEVYCDTDRFAGHVGDPVIFGKNHAKVCKEK